MKKFFKWLFIGLLVAFVVIQFIRIDKSVPEYDKQGDFVAVNSSDPEGAALLKSACYDCHSYESKYPWYAEIAPVSWWVGHHIEEGREHVNFSLWATYSAEDKAEIIEESVEEIEEGKMPDPNYVKMHAEAEMTEANKTVLINYLQSLSGQLPVNGESHAEDEEDDD